MRQFYILQDARSHQYVQEKGSQTPKVREFNSTEEIAKFMQEPTTPQSIYEVRVHFDNRIVQPELPKTK